SLGGLVMIYLLFSILSSILIGNLLMIFNRNSKTDIVVVFLGNYFVAALFSLSSTRSLSGSVSWQELAFAALAGFLFLFNFFVYHKNIQINGLSISVGVMRIAVIIPIVLSLYFFRERISSVASLGIAFALVAFWMLSEKQHLRNFIWLAILLLITGATDITLKVFSEYGLMDRNLYLFFLFSASFVFTLGWIVAQKRMVNYSSLLYGFVLGIPNQMSSRFFLMGLNTIPASIAYPLVASGIVLVSILCDGLFWKRRFNVRQRFAFGILILGIVLINSR
ncbi:MAG: hypothetical protein U1C33_01145, partial [Candidatus Cloacimonadaceae bacterium]|nr:hypothetical protein [Candidatus Cloacimonadaceae bacterium]